MGTFIAVGGNGGTNAAIIRSTDAGATWADVTPGGGSLTNRFLWVDTDQQGNWMVVAREDLWVSADDGLTWTQKTRPTLDPLDFVCGCGANSFLVINTTATPDDTWWRTDDLGDTWTEVTPVGGADHTLNAAWDGNQIVFVIRSLGPPLIGWRSTDGGQTFSEVNYADFDGAPAWVSYAGGSFIIGSATPAMAHSSTGAEGSWTFHDYVGLYTGQTDGFAYVSPYWIGNCGGMPQAMRLADLTDTPTFQTGGDTRSFVSIAAGDGSFVAVDYLDSGDPVYTGIYTTTGSLTFSSVVGPAGLDFSDMLCVAFGGAAPPPAATTRSWVTWF